MTAILDHDLRRNRITSSTAASVRQLEADAPALASGSNGAPRSSLADDIRGASAALPEGSR